MLWLFSLTDISFYSIDFTCYIFTIIILKYFYIAFYFPQDIFNNS